MLYEDLRGIVLLGFSYGGLVITGALEHIADRVSHLVYLDALVPADGDSLDTISGAASRAAAIGPGADWLVPPLPRTSTTQPRPAGPPPAARAHPARCFSEPVRLARPLEDYPFTRPTSRRPPSPAPSQPGRSGPLRTGPGTRLAWRYREVATTHMIPSNRPDELASLLDRTRGRASLTRQPRRPGRRGGQE